MSLAIITPRKLSGTITAPPSKSDTHRAIICALLSRGVCEIQPVELSNDVVATINAAKVLGAIVNVVSNRLIIDARGTFFQNDVTINCNESASTLRLLMPVVSAFGIKARFCGAESLSLRPMTVYKEILPDFGVDCVYDGALPFKVAGQLRPGRFVIPGNVSSQFVSGLLFALPLLKADSEIVIVGACESVGYIDMTIKTMAEFGVEVSRTPTGFLVPGGQKYHATDYQIEGDWSQAAFFLVAGAMGASIRVEGLKMDSAQGDRVIVKLLQRMGADIQCDEHSVTVAPNKLSCATVFAESIPDLVPILSVLGACARGTTKIAGAARLRYKESNRLRAMYEGLRRLGVGVINSDDGLIIKGQRCFHQAKLNGFNDHRIVMALAIAAIRAQNKVYISTAESIGKSYPSFFEDYNRLGGNVDVLDV